MATSAAGRGILWAASRFVRIAMLPLAIGACGDDCPNCPPSDSSPSGWFLQEAPTAAALNNVHAFNAQMAIAAGEFGTIIRTTDGGSTWETVPVATTEPLFGLSFVNANTGWAVGANSAVLKTTDGGMTWTQQTVSVMTHFREVCFVDENTGWVAGGPVGGEEVDPVILKTTDGGETWETQDNDFTVRTMYFVNASHGFVAGGADFMRTTDGGESWETYDPGPPSWFGSVVFADELKGWIAGGQGFVATTADGGVNWESLDSGTGRNITELYFLNAENGYYVARNPGTIAVTTDGGHTWRFQTDPSDLNPSDISFADTDTGWICGLSGLILKTETGGW